MSMHENPNPSIFRNTHDCCREGGGRKGGKAEIVGIWEFGSHSASKKERQKTPAFAIHTRNRNVRIHVMHIFFSSSPSLTDY